MISIMCLYSTLENEASLSVGSLGTAVVQVSK